MVGRIDAVTLELAEGRRSLSARRRMFLSLVRNGPAMTALAVIAGVVLTAVFAEQIAPHDPINQQLTKRLLPPFWMEGGNTEYLLGTDKLGRDILSRIIYGTRISLVLGFVSTLVSLCLGVVLGLIAGYLGGTVGDFIMRVADTQLAFPFIVAAIAVIAVVGPSFLSLVAVLSIWGWVTFARVTRGEVLAVKEKEYVQAARLVGASAPRILAVHILPNVISPVIVIWTFSVAVIIVIESALSFLGLGVQPPTPAWGSMLADGRELLATAWWLATFPGLAIMITVLAVNIFGDALRDILDPRLR